MNLKAQEIRNRISAELGLKLIMEGFTYKKSSNEYKCSDSNQSFFFCIDQLAWGDHFSINVRLYISDKRIENILEKILGKQRHQYTLGGDIAKIKFSPDGIQVVNQTLGLIIFVEKDIEAAIDSLFQYYTSIAKPFFERYNTLESIHNIINSEPYNNIPAYFAGNYDDRCMKGLIVAKLLNSSNYSDLVAIYDEEMEETFRDFRQEAIENYFKVQMFLKDSKMLPN